MATRKRGKPISAIEAARASIQLFEFLTYPDEDNVDPDPYEVLGDLLKAFKLLMMSDQQWYVDEMIEAVGAVVREGE